MTGQARLGQARGGQQRGRARSGRWLELEGGKWRGDPPTGRLVMRVVRIQASTIPGWVQVRGWRDVGARDPHWVCVLVPAETLRPGGDA